VHGLLLEVHVERILDAEARELVALEHRREAGSLGDAMMMHVGSIPQHVLLHLIKPGSCVGRRKNAGVLSELVDERASGHRHVVNHTLLPLLLVLALRIMEVIVTIERSLLDPSVLFHFLENEVLNLLQFSLFCLIWTRN
jgi:hypothetical protein